MYVRGISKFFILGCLVLGSLYADAAPGGLTYQGKIVKADGAPLEHAAVAFEFTILSPDGLCVLYREQRNNIDMRNSKGLFDTPIGSGARSFPSGPSVGLVDVFNNDLSLSCEGGSVYNPVFTDGRILRVQFYDGTSWRLISPDTVIRSVPFAAFAASSAKLGGHSINDFVLKTGVPTCSTGQVLTSSSSGVLSCIADATGGGGDLFPRQSGQAGKVLQTDGSTVSWASAASPGITSLTGT